MIARHRRARPSLRSSVHFKALWQSGAEIQRYGCSLPLIRATASAIE